MGICISYMCDPSCLEAAHGDMQAVLHIHCHNIAMILC